jgi:hypothetical protein
MPVIPSLKKWRQEDLQFKASLGYTVRHCSKSQGLPVMFQALSSIPSTANENWLLRSRPSLSRALKKERCFENPNALPKCQPLLLFSELRAPDK